MRDDEFFRLLHAFDAELTRNLPPMIVVPIAAQQELADAQQAAHVAARNTEFLAWLTETPPGPKLPTIN